MPSKHTFTIKPIDELLNKYVGSGKGWIDPFAGENSPAEITNDLNPSKPTKYHYHAKDFVAKWNNIEGCLFDPPYSLRQIKECYNGIGIQKLDKETTLYGFIKVKEIIARIIKPGGYVISFGWNSGGMGKKRGFEIIEILLVPHGGHHNDTIVTVEQKVQNHINKDSIPKLSKTKQKTLI